MRKLLNWINYHWWYLFFATYWSAYNWGLKGNPKSNASLLINLILLFNLSAIFQVGLLYGFKLSIIWFVILVVVPALSIPYWSLENDKKFKIKFAEYQFLQAQESNYKRNKFVLFVVLFSVILNSGIALLRNFIDPL